ncbi:SUMF1/EgtB/PvdO family nonheme iron enzyme [Mangrovivirga sp. M17]|uniref:SUMF1/EgtB/PvdO family nonheme iron enzyme n=1 Tax=Mangrovivirga halotolerans TaxID=2993936 RepID=A0ABT3RX53_9BACT|nr:SUMF1/EgtB/PvdO family nonheme iron enzyme [Mangrovivirga halotolerans]MCX2745944.1 SUMF1/EgtB/PvdO family nonheme iron enzyme [Mangrovivirga halotolerans]
MNKGFFRKSLLLAVSAMAVFFQSCGLFGGGGGNASGDYKGELLGAQGRPPGWVMNVPYGMVAIPAGTFHMGQADQNVAASMINLNKQITIGPFYMDDTEITNNEYRQFIETVQQDSAMAEGESGELSVYYPDTTVWVKDFAHHMGDPMMEYYFWHPAFDDYPVVGVSWEAAKYFCKWRTDFLNSYRASQGLWAMPTFRLPSEAEWEYASRGGRDMAKYPWGNPYIRNSKGCMLANFKPGRGNYYDDGFQYTAPVAQYFPNDWGLWDMSGNVAEWCEDAFHPASYPVVWDLNPTYYDEAEPRKVIRGGSWKDIAYYLETGTRTYEHKDSTRAYIGFRCALTNLGRSSGAEFN